MKKNYKNIPHIYPPFNIKYELIIDILSDYWKFENFSRRSSFLNFFSPPQQDHIKQFRQEHESMKNDLHIFVDKALKNDQVIKFIKWTEDLFIKEIGEDDNDPDARKLLKRLRDKKSKYNNSYICKYDVFLCHNNNDQTEVEKIAKNLEDKWIRPWWDNPNLSGNWHEKLSNIIKTVPSAAVFVGKYGIGPTQDMEIKRLLTENTERKRSGIRNFKITSIFLPDYDDSPLPPEIDFINAEFQNVDYRRDSEPTKKIFREITGESDFPV